MNKWTLGIVKEACVQRWENLKVDSVKEQITQNSTEKCGSWGSSEIAYYCAWFMLPRTSSEPQHSWKVHVQHNEMEMLGIWEDWSVQSVSPDMGIHSSFGETVHWHTWKHFQFCWGSFTTWGNSLGQQISGTLLHWGNLRQPFRITSERPPSMYPVILQSCSPHGNDLDCASLFIVSWLIVGSQHTIGTFKFFLWTMNGCVCN